MRKFTLSAIVLATATLAAQQAFAHTHDHHHVTRADGHAPAGVMFDHMHKKGGLMIGYNAQRLVQNGAYQQGENELKTTDALSAYTMLTDQHEMYMHMLHVMYAPTDNITLMLMPMYMSMDMDMVANAHAASTSHDHGHASHTGAHSHGVKGWGDTVFGASYRLFEGEKHSLISTLALSAPTGDYKVKGDDGNPVHYGMQLGAGVWQALPSITYQYTEDKINAGVQLSARQPLSKYNDLGYYIGDQVGGTAWISYLWHPSVSTSLRVQHTKTDSVQGHYNVAHNHSSPADMQANYGGRQTLAGFGVNTVVFGNVRVGAEYMKPVYEKLNGVQQPTDSVWNLSISKAFH
ncbi:MAG: hypothetical protein Q4D05_07775 [Acinetobacter sp.]|nr:hypothetical protein [Acinetobacter sp.]